MRIGRYKGRHLIRRPKGRGPAVVGTATAIALGPGAAQAAGVQVRAGDTLSAVAARHGATVAALARANGIDDADVIYAGRRLRLPGAGATAVSRAHVVQAGETLSEIAIRYGTSVTALAARNDIADPNRINVGDWLSIGGGGGSARSRLSSRTVHVVLAGETLSGIAARYGTSTAALVAANDLADPDLVVEGRHLRIPASAGGPGRIGALLEQEASAHGLDPALVEAVAWQESGWNQKARSDAGAIGVMQVMPDTARYVNESLGGGNLRVRRARDNISLGVTYLRHMFDRTGSVRKGLAAYYSGPGNVKKRLKAYQRTYATAVRGLKRRFD